MDFVILWGVLRYAEGDAEFAHSCVDKFAIVSISPTKEVIPANMLLFH